MIDLIKPVDTFDMETLNGLITDINDRFKILDAPLIGQGTPLNGTLPTDASGLANNVALGSGCYHEVACPVNTVLSGLAGGYDGRVELLKNVGATTITLAHELLSSVPKNCFRTRLGSSFTISTGSWALLIYSGRLERWMVISS